jgi:hypothetical protein
MLLANLFSNKRCIAQCTDIWLSIAVQSRIIFLVELWLEPRKNVNFWNFALYKLQERGLNRSRIIFSPCDRIRSRIIFPPPLIGYGDGSASKWHGSATLFQTYVLYSVHWISKTLISRTAHLCHLLNLLSQKWFLNFV